MAFIIKENTLQISKNNERPRYQIVTIDSIATIIAANYLPDEIIEDLGRNIDITTGVAWKLIQVIQAGKKPVDIECTFDKTDLTKYPTLAVLT